MEGLVFELELFEHYIKTASFAGPWMTAQIHKPALSRKHVLGNKLLNLLLL
jgi:hypothetical protein